MGFADTPHISHGAPVPRLGLSARWRAAREARMVSERARRRLAEQIEAAIASADQRHATFSAVVPVCRPAVHEARGALLDLAERLRAPRRVNPEGVQAARMLLLDGGGPHYAPGEPGELEAAALYALEALDDHGSRR